MERTVYILTGAADGMSDRLKDDIYFIMTSKKKLREYILEWWGKEAYGSLVNHGFYGNEVTLAKWTLNEDDLQSKY